MEKRSGKDALGKGRQSSISEQKKLAKYINKYAPDRKKLAKGPRKNKKEKLKKGHEKVEIVLLKFVRDLEP